MCFRKEEPSGSSHGEQEECQFLLLNMKFMGWLRKQAVLKIGAFRGKPEFSDDMERTCRALQVLSGSSRG